MGHTNRRILFYIITHGWGHRTFIPRHQYPAHHSSFRIWHIPFWVSAAVILLMILLYTFEGGLRQSCIRIILQNVTDGPWASSVNGSIYWTIWIIAAVTEAVNSMQSKDLDQDIQHWSKQQGFFLKQILGGMFITIAMTGSTRKWCKNISVPLKDSPKNMLSFSVILVFVNLLPVVGRPPVFIYMLSSGCCIQHLTRRCLGSLPKAPILQAITFFPSVFVTGAYQPGAPGDSRSSLSSHLFRPCL